MTLVVLDVPPAGPLWPHPARSTTPSRPIRARARNPMTNQYSPAHALRRSASGSDTTESREEPMMRVNLSSVSYGPIVPTGPMDFARLPAFRREVQPRPLHAPADGRLQAPPERMQLSPDERGV